MPRRQEVRIDVIFRILFCGLLMALPGAGILDAQSATLNTVWWSVFILWSGAFIVLGPPSTVPISIMLAMLFAFADLNPKGLFWPIGIGMSTWMLLAVAYHVDCWPARSAPQSEPG